MIDLDPDNINVRIRIRTISMFGSESEQYINGAIRIQTIYQCTDPDNYVAGSTTLHEKYPMVFNPSQDGVTDTSGRKNKGSRRKKVPPLMAGPLKGEGGGGGKGFGH